MPAPLIHRAAVEALLADDGGWRLRHSRLAAMEWGSSEFLGEVEIIAEHVLVVSDGLLYAAELSEPVRKRSARRVPPEIRLYYLATPPRLFDTIVDRVAASTLVAAVAAVDSRLGPDLVFPPPLDTALRRMLDAEPVMRLDPTGRR
ncbi:glucose-6-phosphate dehydrogenase [Nocardia sp. NPDC001965]